MPKVARTGKCGTCAYGVYVGQTGRNKAGWGCGYILATDKRRPCPPGEECEVWVSREDRAGIRIIQKLSIHS